MTVRITKRYDAKCDDCGQSTTTTTEAQAESWVDDHLAQHAHWVAFGAELAGLVYDTSAPDATWHGHVSSAIDAAKEAGFPYLAWNGWVYHVDDFSERLCLTTHVPSLTDASR